MITIIFWEAVYLLWGVIFSGRGEGGWLPPFFQPFSFSFSWENFVPRLLLFLYIIIRAATGFFTFFQGFEERTFKWNCIKSLSLFCFLNNCTHKVQGAAKLCWGSPIRFSGSGICMLIWKLVFTLLQKIEIREWKYERDVWYGKYPSALQDWAKI